MAWGSAIWRKARRFTSRRCVRLATSFDERDGSAGFGYNGKPDFWIHANRPLSGPTHIAIASSDQATVQAFHAAGLAAGGHDNGPPGPRPHYHQNYYGAFVLDPDGNNIEAVCHRPT